MDFAGWFEAYLGGRWYTFDPRNLVPRIGRVLIARGRDASDVALATTFGAEHAEAVRRASRTKLPEVDPLTGGRRFNALRAPMCCDVATHSMRYWLMKSEPDEFSIDDLVKARGQTRPWFGVRNYQARNFMREMKLGDRVLFYHSSCPEPGIAGIAQVSELAHPDASQFDRQEPLLRPQVDARRAALVECRREARAQDAPHPAAGDARRARRSRT